MNTHNSVPISYFPTKECYKQQCFSALTSKLWPIRTIRNARWVGNCKSKALKSQSPIMHIRNRNLYTKSVRKGSTESQKRRRTNQGVVQEKRLVAWRRKALTDLCCLLPLTSWNLCCQLVSLAKSPNLPSTPTSL